MLKRVNIPTEPRVKDVVLDFEQAVWAVLKEVLPNVKVTGCAFHWTQALWRKVQEYGLQVRYTHDPWTHQYLRKILALPFLPAFEIQPAWEILRREANSAALLDLVQYVDATWISLETSNWPPASWSVFKRSVRTNNDIEGWHNALNRRAAGRCQLPLYLLINLLHREASLTAMQIRLVSEKKLKRIQRKKYRDLQAKIFEQWATYEDGSKTSMELLKSLSHLCGRSV